MIPFYPSPSDYPAQVQQVRREQLVELDRMDVQVDLCEYIAAGGTTPKQVAFKYHVNEGNVGVIWDDANCLLRIFLASSHSTVSLSIKSRARTK